MKDDSSTRTDATTNTSNAARQGEGTSRGPEFIDMEPALGCNLRCRMCHVSFMKEKPRFLDLDRVSSWHGFEGKHVSLGSIYEPTIHPQFNDLIGVLNDLGCTISLVTNAKNLNQKELGNLFSSRLGLVTFSFDGATRESYEYVRRYGKFASTIENIRAFIENAFARDCVSRDTTFVVNFTANRGNMLEVKEAILLWSDLGIDTLNIIAMVDRFNDDFFLNNSLRNDVDSFCRILDSAANFLVDAELPISIRSAYFGEANRSLHLDPKWKRFRVGTNIISTGKGRAIFDTPLHRQFNFGPSDIGHGNCRAPYNTARIDFDGNIFICQKIRIGSLYESDLLHCWAGSKRDRMIGMIRNNISICDGCDYFRFCINSPDVDYSDPENFRSAALINNLEIRSDAVEPPGQNV